LAKTQLCQVIVIHHNLNMIKNNNFELSSQFSGSHNYECPQYWESTAVMPGAGGPVISCNNGPWAPSPIPNGLSKFLVLQPYNDREICFVNQKLTLKAFAVHTLTFYGVSRPGYPKGTLVIQVDSIRVFEEEFPYNWTKYSVDFTSNRSNPVLSLNNYGIDYNYATCITCVELSQQVHNITMGSFEDDADISFEDDAELERHLLLEIRRRKHQRKAYEDIWEHQRSAKQLNIDNLKMMLNEAEKDLKDFNELSKEYLKIPGREE